MKFSVDEKAVPSQDKIAKKVAIGRTTGKYSLACAGLTEVPHQLHSGEAIPGVAFWEETPAKTVDLSRNEIVQVPDNISALQDLENLALGHNQLRSLPNSLGKLTTLQSLDVSNNHLKEWGLGLRSLSNLRSLACSGNSLASLDGGALPNLIQLSARSNTFQQVPASLSGCSRLIRLDLAANRLLEFAGSQNWALLEELDLSANLMSGAAPASIGALTSLRTLNLGQNRLSGLPADISALVHLAELRLRQNQLQRLPPEIGHLSELHTLDVADNRLCSLPQEVCRLSLGLLDLRNNDLACLPPELSLMSSLKAMPVTGNPLRGFRPSVVEGSLRGLLAALRHRLPEQGAKDDVFSGEGVSAAVRKLSTDPGKCLRLSGQQLTTLPDQIWEHVAELQGLDLSRNSLAGFPHTRLAELRNLRVILLAGNQLSTWPLPLQPGALPQLRELDVSDNPLEAPPRGGLACCAASLTALDVSGLRSLAAGDFKELELCRGLRTMTAERCGLHSFPPALLNLPALEGISLARNSLAQVPEGITKLSALTRLDLTDNSLGSLPPRLGLLGPSLRVLELQGNPLRTIRRATLDKGTRAILDHLKDRIPA